ncbi:13254_t:CDS:2, partial [Racocetra fulgida]
MTSCLQPFEEVEETKVDKDEAEEAKVKEAEVKEAEINVKKSDYIQIDNNLKTEEVTINKAAIIKEICYQSDLSNNNKD